MKRYRVTWRELTYINCETIVEANSAEEAEHTAQSSYDREESIGDIFDIEDATVREIEGSKE